MKQNSSIMLKNLNILRMFLLYITYIIPYSQPYTISNIKLQIILFLIMSSISFHKMFPFVQHSHSLLNIMNSKDFFFLVLSHNGLAFARVYQNTVYTSSFHSCIYIPFTQFSCRNISFINFEINYRNSHHVLQLNFALFLCDGEELDYLIEGKNEKIKKRSRKILQKIFREISCNAIFFAKRLRISMVQFA